MNLGIAAGSRWIVLLLGTAAALCHGRTDGPDWALKAAALPAPQVHKAADAVVLLDETEITVNASASATFVHRVAIRMLSTGGTRWAKGRVSYLAGEKVRLNQAWIIRNGAVTKTKSGSDWLDISLAGEGTIYAESRAKVIDLSSETARDDVFAYETRSDQPLLVAQFQFRSDWSLPVSKETLQLCVPAGFELKTQTRRQGTAELTASPDGRCLSWVLRDQPYFPEEPAAYKPTELKPELFVSIVAPTGPAGAKFVARSFASWGDVSTWATQLGQGQCDTSTAIGAKATELASQGSSLLDKIRALAGYVQKLRYVAIDRDLAKGAGYKPRKASEVFLQGYGDCKDKANLLRALLQVTGIEATLAVVRLDDTYDVHPEAPSPTQFNHAILAIAVDASIDLPSVVEHQGQRLLFFDATDPHTLVGDLPAALQGTKALLIGAGSRELVSLPNITPEVGHRLTRRAELVLPGSTGAGGINGKITVEGRGRRGALLRARLFNASAQKDFDELLTQQLGEPLRAAQLSEKTRRDDPVTGVCAVSFSVEHKRFLQLLPGGTAIARLDVFSRESLPSFSAKERTGPVLLRPIAHDDTLSLDLASTYAVEEMPGAVKFETEYGSYERTLEKTATGVIMNRKVQINAQRVPVADYAKMRQFFSDIAKADRVSVVLRQLVK